MANKEATYFYGQGKVKLAIVNADGTQQPWRWIGDVSALKVGMTEETISHREGFSGMKMKVRELSYAPEVNVEATLHSIEVDNLALFTAGTLSAISEGTVTGEQLPILGAGEEAVLANAGVSSVVITDSSPTPKVLEVDNYSVDAAYGVITLHTLPTGIEQPFSVAYAHAPARQVAFMTSAKRPDVALRYEGINLAENGAPVITEFYKCSPSLLQELSLITDGNEVAGLPVTFSVLLDSRKPAQGQLGQFGRMLQL